MGTTPANDEGGSRAMTDDLERRAWTAEDEAKHKRGRGAQGGQFVAHDGGNSKPGQGHRPMKQPAKPAKQAVGTKQPTQTVGAKPTTGGKAKGPAQTPADIKPETYRGPLKLGGKNDPNQVRELQALLKALGLSTRGATGTFDRDTEDAVKQAQFKLGLKPTGRASAALVRKMMAAHALSPCIKRNTTLDCDDLVRAEFPNLAAAIDDGSLEEEDIVRSDEILRFERTWELEAIEIVRGGDGRTVEAYAAIWDTPAEVRDQHGHYMERISRSAFDKFIHERGDRPIPVMYNHGLTLGGTPSDVYSVPIGRSLEVRAESRGLWTVSRYNDGPDADRVLEAIRNGAITAQSFRGRVFKSDPMRVPRPRGGELAMVTRTELGLAEYGPTPTAVYAGAAILAVRSQESALATLLSRGYDLDQLLELARTSTTPDEEPEATATSDPEAGAEEPPIEALRSADIARRIRIARIHRQMRGH